MSLPEIEAPWNIVDEDWDGIGYTLDHPIIWNQVPYGYGRYFPPEVIAEHGLWPGSRLDLLNAINQPLGHNGTFRLEDLGTLLYEYSNRNSLDDRWRKPTFYVNSFDEERVEHLLLYPKHPEFVAASHDALRSMEDQSKEIAGLFSGLHSFKNRKYQVIAPDNSGKLRIFGPHFYHPIFDAAHSNAPHYQLPDTSFVAFDIPDASYDDASPTSFQPFQEFVHYIVQANEIARMIGGKIGILIENHLSHAPQLVGDYLETYAQLAMDTITKYTRSKAWYKTFVNSSYHKASDEPLTGEEIANINILWGAALVEHFLNLHALYGDLHRKNIPTSYPIFDPSTNTIALKNTYQMNRSIQSLYYPKRKPKPITVEVSANEPLVVMSANNEGKTFTFQTVIQSLYESLQGRLPFAEAVRLPFIKGLFVVPAELPQIPGESGYTSQMLRIVEKLREIKAVRRVNPDARVVLWLDEPASGTDEYEATALLQAIIKYCKDNNIILLVGTNNELVFNPELARFTSIKNRKIVSIGEPKDIIARRSGIKLLASARLPEDLIADAGRYMNIRKPESSTPKHEFRDFTPERISAVLGLLKIDGGTVSYGENLSLLYQTPSFPLIKPKEWLVNAFHTDIDNPMKSRYRWWWSRVETEDLRELTDFFNQFSLIFYDMYFVPRVYKDKTIESLIYKRMIQNAKNFLEFTQQFDPNDLPFPDEMKKMLEPFWNGLMSVLTNVSAINPNDYGDTISPQIIEYCTTLSKIHSGNFDQIAGFFWLSELFRKHEYCHTEWTSGKEVEATGIWSPALKYDMLSGNQKENILVKNNISLSPNSPNFFVGPNKSGKSRLIEALGVAVYMALHFGHAPADRFILGDQIRGVIGLTDFTRDPQRQKDSGKWLTRQSQIADALAMGQKGDYIYFFDEPDEASNPAEGKAVVKALAKHIQRSGNVVGIATHKHMAVDDLDEEIGVRSYTSGLGESGQTLINRYVFGLGTGQSFGIEMAREMGLFDEIITDAYRFYDQLMAQNT